MMCMKTHSLVYIHETRTRSVYLIPTYSFKSMSISTLELNRVCDLRCSQICPGRFCSVLAHIELLPCRHHRLQIPAFISSQSCLLRLRTHITRKQKRLVSIRWSCGLAVTHQSVLTNHNIFHSMPASHQEAIEAGY